MKFYKIRAFAFLFITRLISKILVVEIPPIVSVAAIIEREGKILSLDLSYLKGFGLPGGIVKENEDIEGALKREVLEETGLTVTSFKYLWSVPSFFKGIPTISLFFRVEAIGDIKDSIEGKLAWMNPNDIVDKMAYESARIGLNRYLSTFK